MSAVSADYLILKVFDCTCYYCVTKGKLEPKVKKKVFMDYGDGVKRYKV